MNDNTRAAIAELIGTFTLVFIGAGAGAIASAGGGLVGVALAHGFALVVIVYKWGTVSGAHVNPAVTFAVALTGRMDWGKAVIYWIAQLVGAAIAAYMLLYILGPDTTLGQTTGSLTLESPVKTVLVEAVLTFFLVTAVYGTAVTGRNGNAVGIAIGYVLVMDILMGGPLTGASMNPARTFGPALAMGNFSYLWMYVAGPLLGGGVGALVYNALFVERR
jgi:MIP family channel proteins